MLWHEFACDECCTVLDGFAGTGNYNLRLKKIAKNRGWLVKKNGNSVDNENSCHLSLHINGYYDYLNYEYCN
jgi:DNA polymerase/3'-5' exonuclease PolX